MAGIVPSVGISRKEAGMSMKLSKAWLFAASCLWWFRAAAEARRSRGSEARGDSCGFRARACFQRLVRRPPRRR